jgi:hypothetical protein
MCVAMHIFSLAKINNYHQKFFVFSYTEMEVHRNHKNCDDELCKIYDKFMVKLKSPLTFFYDPHLSINLRSAGHPFQNKK